MILKRFTVICDEEGCNNKATAIIKIVFSSMKNGILHPIVFKPIDIKFDKKYKNWKWGWNGEKTCMYCHKHADKLNSKRKRKKDKND